MMKQRLILVISIVVLSQLLIGGCGGSGGGVEGVIGLHIGDIAGPVIIEEQVSTEYAVYASGDTGISYQWSCDPSGAGQFDNATSAITNFKAARVTSETLIDIMVTANSDHYGPVVSIYTLTVREFHGRPLLGTWQLEVYECDPGPAWPVEPLAVTIYQVNNTVHATLPTSLIELIGNPSGFYLDEDGQEARSVEYIYGGSTGYPSYISFRRYLYLFEYDADNNIIRMHLGVPSGICDDKEGLEYSLCVDNPHLKHWYEASYFGAKVM